MTYDLTRGKRRARRGVTSVKTNMEQYIEALQGISYFEWQKLEMAINSSFNGNIGELKRTIQLNDVEEVKSIIRSQFG